MGQQMDKDDTTITVEAKYSVHVIKSRKSLQYNAASSFLYANGVKIHQFKAKESKIKPHHCVWEIFQNTLQLITRRKLGLRDSRTIFLIFFWFSDVNDNRKYSQIFHEKTQYCINVWIYQANVYCSNAGAVRICWIFSYKICIHE